MWAGKWLTAFLVTGQNVFRDAMLSVSERIQGDTSAMSDIDPSDFFGVIRINLGQYRNFPVKVILILLFMVLAYLVNFKRYRFLPKASLIPPLFLISLYPIVWYCVLRNHSIIHFWFSHRNLVVTFMGISSMIAFSLDKKE